jgi:hypothetical protein
LVCNPEKPIFTQNSQLDPAITTSTPYIYYSCINGCLLHLILVSMGRQQYASPTSIHRPYAIIAITSAITVTTAT